MNLNFSIKRSFVLIAAALLMLGFGVGQAQAQGSSQNPQRGSIGLQGRIPQDPPTQAARITFPTNGQVFQDVPIDVTGTCPTGTLVKIFKNEVFAGSAQCTNGTFDLQIDLFSVQNQLVARVFDDLNQEGPVSNKVNVTFNSAGGTGAAIERVIIGSKYAKKGADPGQELTWPITVTGGVPPYAVQVNWGDGTTDIYSLSLAGELVLKHTYDKPGVYRMIIKAVDEIGTAGFLQLVAIANGPAEIQTTNEGAEESNIRIVSRVPTWPFYILIFLIILTFYLGRRYERRRIKHKLEEHTPL